MLPADHVETGDLPSVGRSSLGIFFLSLGILLVEITLTRVFSFAISYHFAYLTIATALLGFGSAGSLVAAFPGLLGGGRSRMVYGSALGALATVGTLAFSSVVRFNPIRLGSNPQAIATLGLYYLVVTVPFLMTGLAVVTILASRPKKIGRLYAWDLLGAGLGCAVSVELIWILQTPSAVIVGALAIATGGLVLAGGDRRLRRVAAASLPATLVLGVLTVAVGPFPPSPGKFLSSFLATPGAIHLFEQWTPLSRVDAVGWKPGSDTWKGSYAVSGVSKRFTGRGPEFRMIGYDGGSFAVMYHWAGDPTSLDMFHHHIMTLPYRFMDHPETLIIGLGGGADALAGIANGVGHMTGLELNPVTVRLGAKTFADFNGDLFNSKRLDVVTAEARNWVEAHDDRFDLIVLNSIDTLSALSSGAYVLAESYLYTADAFTRYLQHLRPGGTYALFSFDNNGVAGPTQIILRFASTVIAALERLGVDHPERNVAVIASDDDVPLVATLVRRQPFSAEELARLDAFVKAEGFIFWQRPDREVDHQVGRFMWMGDEARQELIASHYLRLDAPSDEAPFFFNFYKWGALLGGAPDAAASTPATGQRMLLVMVVQALIVSLVMIIWPLRRLDKASPVRKPLGFILFFSALGIGFILLEISLMQRFVLYLGFPTYSLSVVLFALLTSTGIGSALTSRLKEPFAIKTLPAAALVALAAIAFSALAPSLFSATLAQPLAVRVAISILVLLPLGIVLGTFFPLGIRTVETIDERLVPWAWAINGCTTVFGTIATVMLAMAYGFDVVMLMAVLVYVGGAIALLTVERARA